MAIEDAKAVIHKAMTDDLFRLSLSKDVKGTLRGYNLSLSDDELEALSKVDWSQKLPTQSARDATWVHVYKSDVAITDPNLGSTQIRDMGGN